MPALLLLLLLVLFSGCQKESVRPSKSLRIGIITDASSLHPHNLQRYIMTRPIGKLLYEGLVRIDEQGEITLAGAEKIEISSDGKAFIFTLHEHKWSDGTPVTAYQYERAWKWALAPTSNCPRADLFYPIKKARAAKQGKARLSEVGVEAIDDRTLIIELESANPHFLTLLTQPMYVPLVAPEQEPTVFNGPFIPSAWKRDDHILLKKNPSYWDHAHIHLQGIDVMIVPDPLTAYSLFETRQLDWIGDPFNSMHNEVLAELEEEGKLQKKLVSRSLLLFLNTQYYPLSSPYIRQALGLVIDRELITQHILFGDYPHAAPLPISLSTLTGKSLLPDIKEARRLFHLGLHELQLKKHDFPHLKLIYFNENCRKQLAAYLQQVWQEAFGITIELEGAGWNTYFSKITMGDYEIGGISQSLSFGDPLELLERFEKLSTTNYSLWILPEYQEIIQKIREASTTQERNEYIAQAEALLYEHMPFISLSNRAHQFAHVPSLTGYSFDPAGAVDLSRAYFEVVK